MKSPSYSAETITVLDGIEAVRRRPGMYVGDTRDGSGLHHLAWEVIGNAIDEHFAGLATRLRVTMRPGALTVEDDGGGLRDGRTPDGRSELVRTLTVLLAGGKFRPTRHVHLGPDVRGVGLPAVTALAERLDVLTHQGGRRVHVAFERGRVVEGPRDLGRTTRRGTTISLRPDPTIFASVDFSEAVLRQRLAELAALCPALEIDFDGGSGLEPLTARRGLVDLVLRAAPTVTPIRIQGMAHDVLVDVVLGWRADGAARVRGFANCARADAGTHVDGLWTALEDAVLPEDEAVTRGVRRELVGEGLEAIVDVRLYDASWDSPTRSVLGSVSARDAVVEVVSRRGCAARIVAEHAVVTAQAR